MIKKTIIILIIICFSVVPLFAETIYNGYVETADRKIVIVDNNNYELNDIIETNDEIIEEIIAIDKDYIILKQENETIRKLYFEKIKENI